MNSTISCSRLLAAVLCGAVLAGCDSIRDVRDEPHTAIPAQPAVLGGSIRGLGTMRPLVLQNNGEDVCVVPVNPDQPSQGKKVDECIFYGVPNVERSNFIIGSLPAGSSYDITVKRQPFGKSCTPTRLTGTVGAGSDQLEISCENLDAVAKYTVTANILPAASSQPGLKVILTTENGSCEVDAEGETSITFDPSVCPNSGPGGFHENATHLWGSGVNLPIFAWRVTATVPGATPLHPVTNCWVDGGPVTNTGGNIGDDGVGEVAPTGNVTLTVRACVFPVRALAVYSIPTVQMLPTALAPHVTSGGTFPTIPAGEAISLVLRAQPSGIDVAAARITSFVTGTSGAISLTDAAWVPFMEIDDDGNPTATQYGARSDINAFYEVVVTGSPTGMTCIPGGTVVSTSNANASTGNRSIGGGGDHGYSQDGSAILLRNPGSARVLHMWVPDKVIRCRLLPAPESQLRGVYHHGTVTTRTQVIGGAAPVTRVTTVRELSPLALFEDGTYIFGFHVGGGTTGGQACPSCGVQQGFYHYDPAQQAIRFIPFTATTGPFPAATASSTNTGGLFGLNGKVATSAGSVPLSKTLTNFTVTTVDGRQVLHGLFTPLTTTTATTGGVTTDTDTTLEWRFTEVGPDPYASASTDIMDGAWVSWDVKRQVEDRQRIFVYQHSAYNGAHVGVNGIPNIQMLCYAGNLGQLSGAWTRLSNTSLLAVGGGINLCGQNSYNTVEWDDGTETTTSMTLRISVDNPYIVDTPTIKLRNFPGRWPQSEHNNRGVRNELVPYEIRLAGSDLSDPICPNADKLTVGDGPNRPAIVLCRVTVN